MNFRNKTFLIFGGTGSLGYELNKRLYENNIIYNFSRDENKHWEMKLNFNSNENVRFIIGNVSDKDVVTDALIRVNPHYVIIASAMKHIDQCEINTDQSIKTNLIGTKNIIDSIELYKNRLIYLNTVIFVSSDKACSPINNYGLCKALSETLMVEKAYYIKDIEFINVRYGNVLNSRGSIIPLLHKMGKDENVKEFRLTDKNMSRFVMTLEQSVDLIFYAINKGETGDTIIPQLMSMNIIDLLEIFSEIYNKPINVTGLRSGEKLQESLINKSQAYRVIEKDNYRHIKSVIDYPNIIGGKMIDYNSDINPLTKTELFNYLKKLNLI